MDKFDMKEGHFPILVMRRRGPLNLPFIIRTIKNRDEFMRAIKDTYSTRAISKIERRTRLQAQSRHWFVYRRCLITGTMARRVIIQNLRNAPSIKLNKCISRQFQSDFSTPAMSYGIENEKHALNAFFNQFKLTHQNAQLHQKGLVIFNQIPYIAGSPDGILTCDCCNHAFLVEVKCPYRLRDVGISSWRILEYMNSDRRLKREHTYYNQVNLYQGIMDLHTAFFIVYAKDGIIVDSIDFDRTFFDYQIQNICEYYMNHYLPEIIGKGI